MQIKRSFQSSVSPDKKKEIKENIYMFRKFTINGVF